MKNILIVEDTKAEQQLISALLKQAGFSAFSVDSSEEARQWLANNPLPNLILLDIILPGDSGLDLCREIRENPELKQIPILFCSSKSEDFDRIWALKQGGDEYITKPFVPQKLIDSVAQYVR